MTAGGLANEKLSDEGDVSVLISGNRWPQLWIAKKPEFDRPHRHAHHVTFD